MDYFIWLGILLGATLGLLHGLHLYREIAARAAFTATSASRINVRGLYYALWTFGLWSLFGSYVLALWLVGSIVKALNRWVRD